MPQRIALQFAVAQELAPAVRLLQPTGVTRLQLSGAHGRLGQIHGRDVLIVAGGMGQKRSGAMAAAILREWKPDLLVMAGVAGALDPTLSVADVVAADGILHGDTVLSPSLVPAARRKPSLPGSGSVDGPSPLTGRLLSLDHVLVSAEDKRSALAALAHRPAPLAVEMETAAVARVAAQQGVAWAAVRAVSDTARESLPLDFNRLRTADGDVATSRIALAALTNPAAIPGLIRLGKNTSLAAEKLAAFLDKWISSL